MARLDTAQPAAFKGNQLKAAWQRVSITPAALMPMAGYKPRDHFESVHDTLYARLIGVDNGELTMLFINLDLLLFPPEIKIRLREKLDSAGINVFLYLSATHTHNGVGGWDDGFTGRLVTGSYHPEYIESVAARLMTAIASMDYANATMGYWQAEAGDLVENRLDRENGKTDGKLRGLRWQRSDGRKALMFTFSAHPTSISSTSLALSSDYPGAVINELEKSYDFGMYMGGMVGSHRFAWTPEHDYDFIEKVAPELSARINATNADSLFAEPPVRAGHFPISFGASQARLTKGWKMRDWLFGLLVHQLGGEVTYLELGNTLLIGLPCDFSGEIYTIEGLEAIAAARGKHLIITSFNGDYNGYITFDAHYDRGEREEVMSMNWVGPYYGKYFTDIIKRLIAK